MAIVFEWDETKRRKLIRERQIDILYAARIFRGPVPTQRDLRHDYGEERYISIGKVDAETFVVVHTPRDGAVRLVTAWRAGRRARERYQARVAGRD